MAEMRQQYPVSGRVVWPVRPNVEKAVRAIDVGGSRFLISLEFPPFFLLPGGIKLAGGGWCQLTVKWRQSFSGDRAEALRWAASKSGGEVLLQKVERAQHEFIDVIKSKIANHYDVQCIRHFGPLDWPLFRLFLSRKMVQERIGSSLGVHFRSIPLSLDALPNVCSTIPFEQRTMQRAVELSQCGYPTEGALLAAAVLDAFVQRVLNELMARKGIRADSAEQLLRNVMTKRMATYLDAVLKLASGRSLSEDNPALFKQMMRVNANRNNAIHNGHELTRRDAYDACVAVYEIAMYLREMLPEVMPRFEKQVFFV